MHDGNYKALNDFRAKYPDSFSGKILELGSQDVNGMDHNLPFLKIGGTLMMSWGAEGNIPHMDVWALVPHQEVLDYLKKENIEVIDSFFEEERYGPEVTGIQGTYTLIARKKAMDPTVSVLVLSYNRPRMLREALGSIKYADEVIIVDDGSDFDITAVASEFKFPHFSLVGAPPITVEERVKNQRLPALINEALRQAKGNIITYLCDDDLLGGEWISTLKAFYAKYGEKYHWVRGHCIRFENEEERSFEEQTKHLLVWAESPRQLITGNFAHLKKCFTDEKIQWDETKIWGHDTAFFDNAEKFHDTWCVPMLPQIACFRRIHDKMLTNHCFLEPDGTVVLEEFSPSAIEMLKNNKFLE